MRVGNFLVPCCQLRIVHQATRLPGGLMEFLMERASGSTNTEPRSSHQLPFQLILSVKTQSAPVTHRPEDPSRARYGTLTSWTGSRSFALLPAPCWPGFNQKDPLGRMNRPLFHAFGVPALTALSLGPSRPFREKWQIPFHLNKGHPLLSMPMIRPTPTG